MREAGGAGSKSPAPASMLAARDKALLKQGLRDRTGRLLPLNAEIWELGSAGVAVPLFFQTAWALIWMFVIALLVSIPSLHDNWQSQPTKGWAMRLALGPYQHKTEKRLLELHAENALCIALAFILFLYYIHRIERTMARQVDRDFVTPGDFAVEVRDIPRHITATEDLEAYFAQYGELSYLEYALRSSEVIAERERWSELNLERLEQKARVDALGNARGLALDLAGARKSLSALEQQLRDTEARIRQLQVAGLEPTGVAFVVFETEEGRRRCLEAHKLTALRLLILVCTCGHRGQHPRFLESHYLHTHPAPEPDDVFWQNLHFERHEVRRLALRTLGAALLVIVLATAVLTILDYAVEQKVEELKENELKNESVSRMVSNFGIAESWLRGFLLKPVSGALSQTVTWLTLAEHRYTRTDFEQSLFSKVALVIVLNEALSSLFMAGPMSEWYGDHDDSVMTSQLAVVLIGLTPALITLVQPDVLWRRYVKARAAKTQEKMDQLWEPQPFGLGDAYAGMTTTTALGLIFGPAMPIVYPITALALALQYFANKYALLRVHSKPPMLGGGLSEIFTRYLAILIGCSLCLQVFLYGGYDYFSWKDVQYLHAAVEGAAAGQHVSRVLAPPDMPVYGLLALLLYTLVPVTVLPCFRRFVDLRSRDTHGAKYSQTKDLKRYECPARQPAPSIDDVEANGGKGGSRKPPPKRRLLRRPTAAQHEEPELTTDIVDAAARGAGFWRKPQKTRKAKGLLSSGGGYTQLVEPEPGSEPAGQAEPLENESAR